MQDGWNHWPETRMAPRSVGWLHWWQSVVARLGLVGIGDQWLRDVGTTVLVRGTGRTFRGSGRGLALDLVGELFAIGLDGGSETDIMGVVTLGFGASGSEIEKVGTLPLAFGGSEMLISGVVLSEGPEKENVGTLLVTFGGSSTDLLCLLEGPTGGLVFKGSEMEILGGMPWTSSGTLMPGTFAIPEYGFTLTMTESDCREE